MKTKKTAVKLSVKCSKTENFNDKINLLLINFQNLIAKKQILTINIL